MPETNSQHKHTRQDSGLTFALQALLERHEAYVKESQDEQERLSTYVADLENDKASLQDENHKIVLENKDLLQKLERLNNDFGESGRRVRELEILLQDHESEVCRVNGLTRKTQELELKVMDMERERVELNNHLEKEKLETCSTVARWKESERRVRELEHEIQKVDFEAKLDRERHEEIVARLERQRTVERELNLTDARIKTNSATQNTAHDDPQQKQVVSHFVRDILQDNANLQAGIAELREMLHSSNDEVQNLRDQVMLHQPMHEEEADTQQSTQSLSEELALSQPLPKRVQQEVHVHHHYHTKTATKKERTTPIRRTSRRRAFVPSYILSSSPSISGTSTPFARPNRHVSNPTVPLSVQSGKATTNRWSMQSNTTTSTYLSSMASSPKSYFDRNSSIFDHLEREEETSRPTSPDSFRSTSPIPFKRRERCNDHTLTVFEEESPSADEPNQFASSGQTPAVDMTQQEDLEATKDAEELQDNESTPTSKITAPSLLPQVPLLSQTVEPQEPNPPRPPDSDLVDAPPPSSTPLDKDESSAHGTHRNNLDLGSNHTVEDASANDTTPVVSHVPETRQPLRRSRSHDSLVSISGMDIHLARHPTQSALTLLRTSNANKHHFAPSPAQTRKVATQPLASITEYTAISRPGLDNQSSASMLALSGIARTTTMQANNNSSRSLMGSVGGWVSRKWGAAPPKPVVSSRPTTTSSASSSSLTTPTEPPPRPGVGHAATTPLIHSNASISTTSTTTPALSKRSISTTSHDTLSTATSIHSSTTDKHTAQLPNSNSGSTSASSAAAWITTIRKPGINQSGPIPGFAAIVAARKVPTEIEAQKIDIDGLKASLSNQ